MKNNNRGCLSSIFILPFAMVKGVLVMIFTLTKGLFELLLTPIKRLLAPKSMTGHEYEYYVADYLRGRGYHNVSVTQGSGDYGVDVLATKKGVKYAVQCKYYSDKVNNKAVQEAVAGKAHYGCNGAMVVTNSTYTEAAKTQAADNGVVLISGVAPRNINLKHPGILVYSILYVIGVVGAILGGVYKEAVMFACMGLIPIVIFALCKFIKRK